jgi:hypothetical protein
MKLKEFIKDKKGKICVLMFDTNGDLISEIYNHSQIPKKLLNMEYMDSEETEDCLEVWIR